MVVRTESSAFGPAIALTKIVRLTELMARPCHRWLIDEAALQAFETYIDSAVFPPQASTFRELGRDAFTQSVAYAPEDARERTVVIDAENLEVMLGDLGRPAVMVVENVNADGDFVKGLARIFGNKMVITAVDEGWLDIEHGGGSGVRAAAQNAAERFRMSIRVFVLFDSDRLLPTDEAKCAQAAAALAQVGVSVHVLRLREAENYLPNRALAASGRSYRPRDQRSLSARIDALTRLQAHQRGHFDMKNGFRLHQGDVQIPDKQLDLFDDVSDADRRQLVGGFGAGVLESLGAAEARLTLRDFAAMGSAVADELDEMLSKLNEVI